MKIKNLTPFLFIFLLLTSCKNTLNEDELINGENEIINEDSKKGKNQLEVSFSCGENNIQEYLDDGWSIVNEYSEEKICTWKSFPAQKGCDMEKDKGCKITKPDKIGEEKIYLLEK